VNLTRASARIASIGISRPGYVREGSLFSEWFGESKVTDEDGQPRVVYHGNWVRNAFEVGQFGEQLDGNLVTGRRAFMWFAENPAYASLFAGSQTDSIFRPKVHPVYLSVQNPLDLTPLGIRKASAKSFAGFLDRAGVSVTPELQHALRDLPNGLDLSGHRGVKASVYMRYAADAMRHALIADGFDGFKQFENRTEGQYVAWGILQDGQARSAFDPSRCLVSSTL
jgi:hypothetical protein